MPVPRPRGPPRRRGRGGRGVGGRRDLPLRGGDRRGGRRGGGGGEGEGRGGEEEEREEEDGQGRGSGGCRAARARAWRHGRGRGIKVRGGGGVEANLVVVGLGERSGLVGRGERWEGEACLEGAERGRSCDELVRGERELDAWFGFSLQGVF